MNRSRRMAAAVTAAITISAMGGSAAFAAKNTFGLDESNWTQQDWNSIAMTNDDTVQTGAVIRTQASSDSDAAGYLYRGAAVHVLDKGDEWTEVQSGRVTGYVKNEYLTYGEDAKGLAEYYGSQGVVTNWNDVNVFQKADADSAVEGKVADGHSFTVAEDNGHWLAVQVGADRTGYVSEEDVSRMLLVDTAVPADGEDDPDAADAADLVNDTAAAADEGQSAEDTSYQQEGADQTSDDVSYQQESVDQSSEDTASQEQTVTDTPAETVSAENEQLTSQTVSSDSNVQALYDAYVAAQNAAYSCTSEEDANAKAAAATAAYQAYVNAANGVTSSVPEETASAAQTAQTETPQTEAPQTEAPQTEAPQTEAAADAASAAASTTNTGSFAGYSDLDLLAAIIWCEAGNQPYDGMVAVGEVVMNRVASGSFPNTIAEVLNQPGQFTPASSGVLQSALASGVNATCYQAAQDALNGAQPVPGALYFNTHSGTTKLGAHYFS